MRAWMTRPLHISWYFAATAAGVLAGTALAGALHVKYVNFIWVVTGAVLLFAASIRRYTLLLVAPVLFGLLLGVWRGSLEQHALQSYTPFYGQKVILRGIVSDDTSYGPKGDQRLRLKNVTVREKPLHGQVWVSTTSSRDIKRSDVVTFSGKLGEGFSNLPASMFYARLLDVARPQPGDIALRVRDWFAAAIRQAIPEPQSSLGIGYLVGQRSTLPEQLDNELKVVGLTHVVVASGYNLTILVALARRSLSKVSKYLAVLAASMLTGGFMLVTGFSPSMTRAGLVVGLGLAAWYYGRKVHPLVLLPLAAAITLLLNPAYIWGDIGWALSFTSFAGVILLAPLIHAFFWGNATPGTFRQICVDTLSAQLVTMPIIIWAFGQYSPYALLANVLVLPLIPLTMLLVFAAGIISLAMPGLAHLGGLPATTILQYMTTVVDKIATLPNAQSSLSFTATGVVLSYGIISVIIAFLWHKTVPNFRQGSAAIVEDKSTT